MNFCGAESFLEVVSLAIGNTGYSIFLHLPNTVLSKLQKINVTYNDRTSLGDSTTHYHMK